MEVAVSPVRKTSFSKKKRQVFVLVLLIFLAISGIVYTIISIHLAHEKIPNQAKLSLLLKTKNCKPQAIGSVIHEKVNVKYTKASESLLEYRGECKVYAHNYIAARTIYQQLKQLYIKNGQPQMGSNIGQEIQSLNYNISHPIDFSQNPPSTFDGISSAMGKELAKANHP